MIYLYFDSSPERDSGTLPVHLANEDKMEENVKDESQDNFTEEGNHKENSKKIQKDIKKNAERSKNNAGVPKPNTPKAIQILPTDAVAATNGTNDTTAILPPVTYSKVTQNATGFQSSLGQGPALFPSIPPSWQQQQQQQQQRSGVKMLNSVAATNGIGDSAAILPPVTYANAPHNATGFQSSLGEGVAFFPSIPPSWQQQQQRQQQRSGVKMLNSVAATNGIGNSAAILPPVTYAKVPHNATGFQSSLGEGVALFPSIPPSWQPQQQRSRVKMLNSRFTGHDLGKASAASSPREKVFNSCQQRVNLWQHMTVEAKDVKRGELLGLGAYAKVFEGYALGMQCAIKAYRSTASEKQIQEAMREIRLGTSLDHPCTLRILAWVRDPLQTITELCCGDLKAFYSNKIEALQYSEMEALRLLRVRHTLATRAWKLFLNFVFTTTDFSAYIDLDRKAHPASTTSTPSASSTAISSRQTFSSVVKPTLPRSQILVSPVSQTCLGR